MLECLRTQPSHWISSLSYTHSLGNIIQDQCFKYHLYTEDSQVCIALSFGITFKYMINISIWVYNKHPWLHVSQTNSWPPPSKTENKTNLCHFQSSLSGEKATTLSSTNLEESCQKLGGISLDTLLPLTPTANPPPILHLYLFSCFPT